MTLYKGQTTDKVELLPGESRETLFTEQIRRRAYKAMNKKNDDNDDNSKLDPDLLSSLVKLENAGSIQASNLIGMLMAKKLIDVDSSNSINTAQVTRGSAGPGFSGELNLGPYAYGGESIEDTNSKDTLDFLRKKGIADPYSAIEQE